MKCSFLHERKPGHSPTQHIYLSSILIQIKVISKAGGRSEICIFFAKKKNSIKNGDNVILCEKLTSVRINNSLGKLK